MAEHRPLGKILVESGRITEADVERALQHQREHGGYIGQALVTLGVMSRGELDWALASHFDLPFIFPQPEAVDQSAARLVTGDWALANMAVPIVQAGRSLTVVVASPLRPEVLGELQRRTGLDINMALAAADGVRDLIHSVYGMEDAVPAPEARSCADFLADALAHSARAFGISRRGDYAVGWWRRNGDIERVPLLRDWEEHLARVMAPSPTEHAAAAPSGSLWPCTLRARSRSIRLEAQALVGERAAEYRFVPLDTDGPPPLDLPRRLTSELRLLAASGAARVAITAVDPERARSILPLLPGAVLGEETRALHVTGRAHPSPHTLTAPPPADAAGYDALQAWGFDAVTADLPTDSPGIERLSSAARLVMLLVDTRADERLGELGFGWLLHMPGDPDAASWTLRPLPH